MLKKIQLLIKRYVPSGIYNRLRKEPLWGGLVILAVVVGAILLFSGSWNAVSGIDLQVLAPEETKSGESVFYAVRYKNLSSLDLENVELILTVPKSADVVKKESDALVERETAWEIIRPVKLVKAGRRAQEIFEIRLFGLPGDEVSVRAEFVYDARGHEIRREALATTRVESSPLVISLSLPERSQISSEVKFSVEYFNQGDFDIVSSALKDFPNVSNLELRLGYPDGFSFLSASPKSDRASNVWLLSDVPHQSGGKVEISGRFSGEAEEEKSLFAEIGLTDAEGDFIVFARSEAKTKLSGAALSVFQTVNDRRDYVAQGGENLIWQVNWRNSLNEEVSDVKVELQFDSLAIDLNSIVVDGASFDLARRTVLWDKASNPVFAVVRPSEGGTFTVALKTREIPPFNSVIKARAKIWSPSRPELSFEDVLEVKVASQANIAAQGFYYTGQFLNAGPIPPRVNQATTYTIVFKAFNSSNELKDARVKAVLPAGVQWLGVFAPSDSSISFEPFSREVTWNIGQFAAGQGLQGAAEEISFQISFVPNFSQAGQPAPLLENILFEGFDVFSGSAVRARSPNLTTQLLDDSRVGYTGGIVQP